MTEDISPIIGHEANPELVRITPEEFSAALVAIDARRYAEAEFIATTVPIGEAIRELGVEVTSADVLREVLALRREAWSCPNCGERIELEFDTCWQCGTGRDGMPPANPTVYYERETVGNIEIAYEEAPEGPDLSDSIDRSFEFPCAICGETSWLLGRLNGTTFSTESAALRYVPVISRACARCGYIALFVE